MPSELPDGEAASGDGSLPASALREVGSQPFGFYVHVPFCEVRCGYCDFNTYTSTELGQRDASATVSRSSYSALAAEEVRLARKVLGDRDVAVSTVFIGGGTPTLLPAADLVGVLDEIRSEFGLAADAEVTVEANPDSVDARQLDTLRSGGVTRISFGMQSAVPAVLRVLDRTHDPRGVPRAVANARAAGLDVSLDLIYGTPGETPADWETTLEAAVGLAPDHVSAYALIVEPGTALARRVSRGEVPSPDDDDLADKYERADAALTAAGLAWYEVSNWARGEAFLCRHNIGYWTGGHWWGVGPGAHSHVGGVRWWNVKHPSPYAERLSRGLSPAAGRERLDSETRRVERVLLELRLRDGLPLEVLDQQGLRGVSGLEGDGLVRRYGDRLVLTLRGRLLADAAVRALVG